MCVDTSALTADSLRVCVWYTLYDHSEDQLLSLWWSWALLVLITQFWHLTQAGQLISFYS